MDDVASFELPLSRLEAFSDAVLAIAVTLLVLELGVTGDAEHHLFRSILHQWPSYLAFVTSFLTIGVVWLQHSAITGALRTADVTLYRLNLLVLLLASFLPFPTKLVAEFIGETKPERVAVVFYGLMLLALSLAMSVFVRYAAENPHLVKDEVEAIAVERAQQAAPNFGIYGVGIGIAILFPTFGVIAYLVSAVVRGIPGQTLRRLLRQG
jgi:uncharacterized membrane protein